MFVARVAQIVECGAQIHKALKVTRGPWVAHLRKRSKVTVKPFIENPRGIILISLVEDLLMMLYTKYESSGPCSYRQEVFLKIAVKN